MVVIVHNLFAYRWMELQEPRNQQDPVLDSIEIQLITHQLLQSTWPIRSLIQWKETPLKNS